jgi:hypothetical protein
MTMTVIPSEVIIACGDTKAIFSAQRIVIRVADEGGGVYLAIEGIDDDSEENAHCLYLQTEAEIDQFASICKKVLKDASTVSETE